MAHSTRQIDEIPSVPKNPLRPDPRFCLQKRSCPLRLAERFARQAGSPERHLQDVDIVYAVTDTQPFIDNTGWIARFGKPLMVQEPDRAMPDAASAKPDKKTSS